jgi:hypothetical protein
MVRLGALVREGGSAAIPLANRTYGASGLRPRVSPLRGSGSWYQVTDNANNVFNFIRFFNFF